MRRLRRPTPLRAAAALLASLASLAAVPAGAATILVDTDADADVADAACSLREAIVAANTDAAYNGCGAGSGADRIEFALATPATIVLGSDLPAITASAGILGPGMDELVISGNQQYLLLTIDSPGGGASVLVADLTLSDGRSADVHNPSRGGGATVSWGDRGYFRRVRFYANRAENGAGGLLVDSTSELTAVAILDRCIFEGNVAEGPTGGGGLYANSGSQLTVTRSSFIGNSTEDASGAGLLLRGVTATIRRSTISGNQAWDSAGGLYVTTSTVPAEVTISDSTISGNVCGNSGGPSDGGGIYVTSAVGIGSTLRLRNTVVAGNFDLVATVRPDVNAFVTADISIVSEGHNLIGSNVSNSLLFDAGSPNAEMDYVGTGAAPIDALLGALADNGGDTPTHLPDAGSPVIDRGDCLVEAADQRGYVDATSGLRPVDDLAVANVGAEVCDIGAVEAGAVAPALPPDIFADGFESGTTFAWSEELTG